MIKRIAVMAIIGGLLSGLWMYAEEPKQPDVKADQAKIEVLIKQLGDDEWETRESAQKELIQIGEKMIEEYRKVKAEEKDKTKSENLKGEIEKFAGALQEAGKSDDAEIKMRANEVRQYLYSILSPSKIVFLSNRDSGHREIYLMDADYQNQKRLIESKGPVYNPTWSPDGTKIAFVSTPPVLDVNRVGNNEIYIMDADGKNQKRLTENKIWAGPSIVKSVSLDWDGQYAWSPDGTKIAFVSKNDGNPGIYVIDVDGKNQKRLTENKTADYEPRWSPDGTKIAFVSNRDGNNEIYIMDAGGKNQKRLTENKEWNGNPTWNSDGTRIAFLSKLDKAIYVYVMDTDGKNHKRLTENPIRLWTENDESLYRKEPSKPQNFYRDWGPAWGPDGTKIAFVSGSTASTNICIMDVDGKNQKSLTEGKDWKLRPVWNPDSSKIMFEKGIIMTELYVMVYVFSGSESFKG